MSTLSARHYREAVLKCPLEYDFQALIGQYSFARSEVADDAPFEACVRLGQLCPIKDVSSATRPFADSAFLNEFLKPVHRSPTARVKGSMPFLEEGSNVVGTAITPAA
ncbi:hypothetical protein PMN64_06920 [Bradyrhizobium sp. UFLA01-814]|uniref:hypothetical protein n=1 Tax=Bradyrhizobium sp. UFLA01-814 TaxID=3023480 RepID=UPI00398ACC90